MKTKRPRVLACRRACAHNTLALRLHDERHARASHATGAHRVTRARCAPLRSPCKERCTTARRGTPCVAAVAPCRAQQAFPPPSSPTPSATTPGPPPPREHKSAAADRCPIPRNPAPPTPASNLRPDMRGASRSLGGSGSAKTMALSLPARIVTSAQSPCIPASSFSRTKTNSALAPMNYTSFESQAARQGWLHTAPVNMRVAVHHARARNHPLCDQSHQSTQTPSTP